MADTGKTVRVSRSNFPGTNIGGGMPTERSQIVGREVHQYRSESEGLEGLNAALDNFFGLASQGIAAVQNGLEVGQRARIAQENEAQKRKGAGDAMLGKELDPAFTDDLDYYDAYRAVRAQRDGFGAYQDFQKWYLNDWLPGNPTGDLAAAREEWAASNLTGADDPEYEGQVLASFFNQSDQLISQHTETAYKFQIQKGIQAAGEAIDSEVVSGTMTPDRFQFYVDAARKLDPLNANEAPARVMSALLASANNHPEKAMAIAALLEQPGTGTAPDKSFAQSFPDRYAEFQQNAEAAFSQVNSLKEGEGLNTLKEQLRQARKPEDYLQLTVDIYKFRQQFGNIDATEALLASVATEMQKVEEKVAAQTSAAEWMAGNPAADPAEIKKDWLGFLESQTGQRDILKLPTAEAAQVMQDLRGVVPDDLRNALTSAISDPRDPVKQGHAFEVVRTLAENAGLDYAMDYLNGTSKGLFKNVWERMRLTDAPLEDVLAQTNEAAAAITDWDVDWKTITGAGNDSEATTSVRRTIQDNLNQLLGDPGFFGIGAQGVTIPPTLEASVLKMARQSALMAQATGRGWQEGVKDAMQEIARNSEVIPGPDGQRLLRIGSSEADMTYFDEFDNPARRVRLGFNVVNPNDGRPVNTLEVYDEQLTDLVRSQQWVLPPGADKDSVGLVPAGPSDPMTRYGLYEVHADGKPIVFSAGQKVRLGYDSGARYDAVGRINGYGAGSEGQDVELPDTAEEMNDLFDLPEGFSFVMLDHPIYGKAWRLGYRPNFGTKAGKSLDQQAADFVPEVQPDDPGFDNFQLGQEADNARLSGYRDLFSGN